MSRQIERRDQKDKGKGEKAEGWERTTRKKTRASRALEIGEIPTLGRGGRKKTEGKKRSPHASRKEADPARKGIRQ